MERDLRTTAQRSRGSGLSGRMGGTVRRKYNDVWYEGGGYVTSRPKNHTKLIGVAKEEILLKGVGTYV